MRALLFALALLSTTAEAKKQPLPLCPNAVKIPKVTENLQGQPTTIKDLYNQTEAEQAKVLYGLQHRCRWEY